MDILKIIKSQISEISNGHESLGLDSVLSHIERGEFLLEQGIKNQDEAFFTDTIYRTNQAFEGILKEAYSYLTGKSDYSNLTPFKIEKYLVDNNIFKERVLEQFTNYRQKWRNPSTHDHKLFFDHSEAFLAIISVLAFIHLLLNQIVEKIAHDAEAGKLKSKKKSIKKSIEDYDSKSNLSRLAALLMNFSNNTPEIEFVKSEYELLGMLSAYIEIADNNFELIREPLLTNGRDDLRPDFLVKADKDEIVIEVKRIVTPRHIKTGLAQLLNYMELGNLSQGILFVPPLKEDRNLLTIETKDVSIGSRTVEIIMITPTTS
ncbi:MAG: hypothetical protein AAGF85_16460 [Bacteroidota bacterium]